MQNADKTIHKGCSVAAEKPFSLSALLGTLAIDNKSHIQSMQHFWNKIQSVHSSTTLNYKATDFHWEGEMYIIQLEKGAPAAFCQG